MRDAALIRVNMDARLPFLKLLGSVYIILLLTVDDQ